DDLSAQHGVVVVAHTLAVPAAGRVAHGGVNQREARAGRTAVGDHPVDPRVADADIGSVNDQIAVDRLRVDDGVGRGDRAGARVVGQHGAGGYTHEPGP